jgi:hypothetical protein
MTERTPPAEPRCIPICAVCGREFPMPVAQYVRNGAGQCCGRPVTLDPFLLDDDEKHPWSGEAEPEVPAVRSPPCGKEFAPRTDLRQ